MPMLIKVWQVKYQGPPLQGSKPGALQVLCHKSAVQIIYCRRDLYDVGEAVCFVLQQPMQHFQWALPRACSSVLGMVALLGVFPQFSWASQG